MKHTVQVFLVCVLLSSSVSASPIRVQFLRLNPKLQELVIHWLGTDCEVGAPGKLKAELSKHGGLLEPVFWEAYELGPEEEELAALKNQLKQDYKNRVAWLQADGARLLGEEEQARLLDVSSNEYISRRTDNLIAARRSASLIAIGIVGTEQSVDRLREIVDDEENMDRDVARESLKNLQERLGSDKTSSDN